MHRAPPPAPAARAAPSPSAWPPSLAPATGAPAASAPLSATDQAVHDRLAIRSTAHGSGRTSPALVTDPETGQTSGRHHRGERQMPASNVKMLTAVNALRGLRAGPPVHDHASCRRDGRRVVLVGGGDPSLSRADLRRAGHPDRRGRLAARALAGCAVDVDDSLFPTPTPARTAGSRPTSSADVSPVRALVVDQHRRWDTSLDAGQVFASKSWSARVSTCAGRWAG